jgi:molybdate transport system substrate-binding protein
MEASSISAAWRNLLSLGWVWDENWRTDQINSVAKMANKSASLNVLISGGFHGAYERLLPEFKRTSGILVTTRSGSSQGTGPQTIAAQLARGVPADVVILSREGLGELIAARRIATGTDVDLAQVPLGGAVRGGHRNPT